MPQQEAAFPRRRPREQRMRREYPKQQKAHGRGGKYHEKGAKMAALRDAQGIHSKRRVTLLAGPGLSHMARHRTSPSPTPARSFAPFGGGGRARERRPFGSDTDVLSSGTFGRRSTRGPLCMPQPEAAFPRRRPREQRMRREYPTPANIALMHFKRLVDPPPCPTPAQGSDALEESDSVPAVGTGSPGRHGRRSRRR